MSRRGAAAVVAETDHGATVVAGGDVVARCAECDAARETDGWYSLFNPLCVWCGARLVQRLQGMKQRIGDRAMLARQKDVRKVWAGYGVDPVQLSDLAGGQALPIQPKPARRGKAAAGS